MCRSSRLTAIVGCFASIAAALAPGAAQAQLYGFPSEVGVFDDGFGVLPPEPRSFVPDFAAAPPPFPPPRFAPPQAAAPAPCPLIIQVGRGLKRAAKTRVTYGRPACD